MSESGIIAPCFLQRIPRIFDFSHRRDEKRCAQIFHFLHWHQDLMQFKKMMHVCAQARAAADENKNKIQMAGDAIDIYLPFRNFQITN